MPATRVRPARHDDIPVIERLLAAESLPVTPIAPHLPGFMVLETDGAVAGCAGIETYGEAAFLRSVVVAPEFRGRGAGDRLVRAALQYAQRKQARHVYFFTMYAANFFARHGFETVGIDDFEPTVRSAPQYIGVSQTPEIAERLTPMRLELP